MSSFHNWLVLIKLDSRWEQFSYHYLSNECFISSCLQIFFKIGVLKNFTIFTGKQLCWSLFLVKLQGWRPMTLLKRDSNTDVFSEYCKIFKNSFFIEHLLWLPPNDSLNMIFRKLKSFCVIILNKRIFYIIYNIGLQP